METVGTAAGMFSLGIQVCQGLLSYHDDWKDCDLDVRSTYDATVDLSKMLRLLKSTLNQGNVDEERAERVKMGIRECEDALRRLEEKLQRVYSDIVRPWQDEKERGRRYKDSHVLGERIP